ncbi:MAG: carboxylating nicotinate-nucleotide diphosphorylase [Candidatus Accumulibacter sp.]|jgi:nicotinate-nucleotide pyrophosphorylase (carboxylating)|nr:carboxylating nicotinate-nucleotide diphosphorylase [Accumulibacter sp.]
MTGSLLYSPSPEEIARNVAAALLEDIGDGDLSAQLITEKAIVQARVTSRENAVLCGTDWFKCCFLQLDPSITIVWNARDGERVVPNATLCEIRGPAAPLLTGERAALNFLQLLSGVATKTRQFVDAIAGTRARIVDTRKTLPGLRHAQKFAVQCGGGLNHRHGLYDAVLIKENHILAAGGIRTAIESARKIAEKASGRGCRFIQVEVETLDELQDALDAGITMILLDNMTPGEMLKAVDMAAGRASLEASGNVTLDNVRQIAETGVNRISIGGLTKDVRAIDLSMRFFSDGEHLPQETL